MCRNPLRWALPREWFSDKSPPHLQVDFWLDLTSSQHKTTTSMISVVGRRGYSTKFQLCWVRLPEPPSSSEILRRKVIEIWMSWVTNLLNSFPTSDHASDNEKYHLSYPKNVLGLLKKITSWILMPFHRLKFCSNFWTLVGNLQVARMSSDGGVKLWGGKREALRNMKLRKFFLQHFTWLL